MAQYIDREITEIMLAGFKAAEILQRDLTELMERPDMVHADQVWFAVKFFYMGDDDWFSIRDVDNGLQIVEGDRYINVDKAVKIDALLTQYVGVSPECTQLVAALRELF